MTERDEDEKLIEAMAKAAGKADGRYFADDGWTMFSAEARRFLAMQRAYEAHEALVEFDDDECLDGPPGIHDFVVEHYASIPREQLAALREERDRLREALEMIAGERPCTYHGAMDDRDVALAALTTDTKGNEDGD